MSDQTTAPKPNRLPWILAGVLGCLVICLLVVLVGGGLFFITRTQTVQAPVTSVPVAVLPTVPTQPTLPPIVLSSSSSSVSSSVSSSAASSAASSASSAPASSSSSSSASSVSSQSSVVPTQVPQVSPTAVPPAAPKGKLAFTVRRGDRPEDNFVWVMNADGTGAKELLKRASEPTFSPDGTKVAFYQWTDGIFVANAADGSEPKKILGESNAGYMSWSHDGRWIAFSVRPGGKGNISTDAIAPDGTGRRPVVVGWSPSWSPDDTQVVFQTCRDAGCGIYRATSAGGEAIPINTDDGGLAAFSPDGKRILYQKDVNGQKQLFLMNADGSNKKQLTSGTSIHVSANWSLDGNFVFYRSPEGGVWGIWRMNADGSNPVKLANDMPPGDWPYDRIAVSK